jgi:hypothetical protein
MYYTLCTVQNYQVNVFARKKLWDTGCFRSRVLMSIWGRAQETKGQNKINWPWHFPALLGLPLSLFSLSGFPPVRTLEERVFNIQSSLCFWCRPLVCWISKAGCFPWSLGPQSEGLPSELCSLVSLDWALCQVQHVFSWAGVDWWHLRKLMETVSLRHRTFRDTYPAWKWL